MSCNVSPWNKGTTISCNIRTFPAVKSVVLQRPVGIQQNATTRKNVNLSYLPGHPPHKTVVTFAIPETGYGGKYVVAVDNGRSQTTKVLTIDGKTEEERKSYERGKLCYIRAHTASFANNSGTNSGNSGTNSSNSGTSEK